MTEFTEENQRDSCCTCSCSLGCLFFFLLSLLLLVLLVMAGCAPQVQQVSRCPAAVAIVLRAKADQACAITCAAERGFEMLGCSRGLDLGERWDDSDLGVVGKEVSCAAGTADVCACTR